jgi:hypothetical protein
VAGLNGKWRLPFTDQDGKERETVFTFNMKGDTVTGALLQNGKTQPIEEGRINGNVLSLRGPHVNDDLGSLRLRTARLSRMHVINHKAGAN